MAYEQNDAAERERRLDEVLGSYLAGLEPGAAPDADELIARHADLAGRLARDRPGRLSVRLSLAVVGTVARPSAPPAVFSPVFPGGIPPGGLMSPR